MKILVPILMLLGLSGCAVGELAYAFGEANAKWYDEMMETKTQGTPWSQESSTVWGAEKRTERYED